MTPKVSVCLLTYNHEHLIAEVLESILTQTYRDFELIVSDDCSTDGTWELIESFERKDARVRVVRTPRNLGMARNANFASGFSRGDFIALLHHDDGYDKHLLEEWVRMLLHCPDCGFVFNDYATVDAGQTSTLSYPERIDGLWFLRRELLAKWGCWVRGTAMIRKSCWDAVGGMRDKFDLLADIDLWMRLARRWPVAYVKKPLILVRHARPTDYPSVYTRWSWDRQRILYEIHAENLLSTIDLNSMLGRVAWLWFRTRVSMETCKWLLYALARRRTDMMRGSPDGAVVFELRPVQWLRALVSLLQRVLA